VVLGHGLPDHAEPVRLHVTSEDALQNGDAHARMVGLRVGPLLSKRRDLAEIVAKARDQGKGM
jgi:hypothetical protein